MEKSTDKVVLNQSSIRKVDPVAMLKNNAMLIILILVYGFFNLPFMTNGQMFKSTSFNSLERVATYHTANTVVTSSDMPVPRVFDCIFRHLIEYEASVFSDILFACFQIQLDVVCCLFDI